MGRNVALKLDPENVMAAVSTKGQAFWMARIKVWVEATGEWQRVWRTTGIPALDSEAKAQKVADTLQAAALSVSPTDPRRADRRVFAKILEDIWRLAGVAPPEVSSSWNQFWPQHVASLEVVEKSRAHYAVQCEAFALHLGARADAMLWDVGHRECQAFYDMLMASGRSHGTARNYLKTVRAVFERAVHLGVVPVNPTLMVRLPMIGKIDRKAFSPSEVAKLLAFVDGQPAIDDLHMRRKGHEWQIAVRLGLYCGMRMGDATHRNWEDFDLDAGTVTFTPQKKARRGKPVVLPLLAPLLAHLRSVRQESGPVTPMLAKETKVSHYFGLMLERAGIIEATVYTVPEGERMNNRTIREKSFHSLRHTVLTELARTGADKQLRQLLADHEDPRVNDRYTHAEVERLAGALALAFPQ